MTDPDLGNVPGAMTLEVVVPGTGELVDLKAMPTDEIAGMVNRVSEAQGEIARFKRAASDELASRLDHEGRRSATVGDYHVSVNAPSEKQWDVHKLKTTLAAFVHQGLISEVKAEACIRNKPEVAWAEVKLLLSDPRLAPEISLCYEDVPSTRYVKITG